MKSRRNGQRQLRPRDWQRFPHVKNLSLSYEGQTEAITIRSPDISLKGMFINTPNHFPEGAVLKLSFVLTHTEYEVQTRCEVRYCLPGVGIGVEFVGISPEARAAIEQEVCLPARKAK